jgi:hypothetical protein
MQANSHPPLQGAAAPAGMTKGVPRPQMADHLTQRAKPVPAKKVTTTNESGR